MAVILAFDMSKKVRARQGVNGTPRIANSRPRAGELRVDV
jgi:hypothetical protein